MKKSYQKVVLSMIIAASMLTMRGYAQVQNNPQVINLETIPYPLEIVNQPAAYATEGNMLRLSAVGKTNLFNNPNGLTKVQNAPMVLFAPKGDFTLSAKVTGMLKSVYDVAALVVYQDENTWAKFCYEYSVDKFPTMVTVVTRTYSDDCNSVSAGEFAYMSVVKKGEEFSFFYSTDGADWKLIRHFRLQLSGTLKAGFATHGSRGNGLSSVFSEIKYLDKALDNMRNDN